VPVTGRGGIRQTNSWTQSFLITGIVIYPLLWIWQGIDLTDTGWMAAMYSNIFTDPLSVRFGFIYYLTLIIGGVWHLLFGWLGLIGIRIADVLCIYLTAWFVYKLLIRYFPKTAVLIALLLTLSLITGFAHRWLYYNNLTALFYVVTAYYLMTGVEGKPRRLFIAGLIAGCGAFIRIPNVLGVLLLAFIIYYGWRGGWSRKKMVTGTLIFTAGFAASAAIIISVMMIVGHFNLFRESLAYHFASVSNDRGSPYTVSSQAKMLLANNLRNYYFGGRKIFEIAAFALLPYIWLRWVLPRLPRGKWKLGTGGEWFSWQL